MIQTVAILRYCDGCNKGKNWNRPLRALLDKEFCPTCYATALGIPDLVLDNDFRPTRNLTLREKVRFCFPGVQGEMALQFLGELPARIVDALWVNENEILPLLNSSNRNGVMGSLGFDAKQQADVRSVILAVLAEFGAQTVGNTAANY